MRQLQLSSDQQPWQWQLDLEAYDRSPVFSEDEYQELEQKMSNPRAQLKKRSWKSLSRLLQPIEDVSRACFEKNSSSSKGGRDRRAILVRVMAIEMYRYKTPFWAWSLEQWLEVIGESAVSFGQRYGWTGDPTKFVARKRIPLLPYLLCPSLPPEPFFERIDVTRAAKDVFGLELVEQAIAKVITVLRSWGYEGDPGCLWTCMSYLLLKNRNPYLENLTTPLLEEVRQNCSILIVQCYLFQVSRALKALGIIESVVHGRGKESKSLEEGDDSEGIAEEWLAWCERWCKQSTLQNAQKYLGTLHCVGRWLHDKHPEITSPAQWTDELAGEFVRAVTELKVGEWAASSSHRYIPAHRLGQPMRPAGKTPYLRVMRCFLHDCQECGWIPLRFNVSQMFRTPRSIQKLIGPKPQVIAKEFWAKILWAAMNLEKKDLPLSLRNEANYYPLELVRAIAMVWCFAALRSDEVVRLPVGCIRWQYEDVMIPETGDILPKDAICFLDIPVNKTSTAYTKAVHPLVGKRIEEWEKVRPHQQPQALDKKTSEMVQFLFSYRGICLPKTYVNRVLIPILCRKAGIPLEDSRGKITSHRARATIASMLYNAKEPLSILELKEYLGHKWLSSTQHYLEVDPTRLASKVAQSGYLEQNMATIEVLLDQEAVMNGAASRGETWKYYDLGHGYCTNPFWAQCAHRMACARCPFYRPKDSLKEQLVEGKANLVHMLEFVSLTEDEKGLVTEGIDLHQELIERLADVPTPAGPTPRELEAERKQETKVIPLKSVQQAKSKRIKEP